MTHPKAPQVWPVIHLSSHDVAIENARIASEGGATGVFLISMDGNDDAIDPVAVDIKCRFPGLKVGVNYLSLPAHIALPRSIALGADATWFDDAGVRSDGVSAMVEQAVAPVMKANPQHMVFGSVAFKYQPVDHDPAQAAVLARDLGMIPTTSGPATGEAPSGAKLKYMRDALGDSPLAVASGISPDNAFVLGRFLTHVLVATGISKSFYQLDAELLKQLMEQLEP